MAELITLARPYAKAAFGYACEAQDLSGWAQQLHLLANVSAHDVVGKVIGSPAISPEQQAQVLIDVCADELSAPVQNFVRLLAENKRLALLPQVVTLFEALKSAEEQAVDVELITAFALDDASEKKLADALSARLARKVKINSVVDQQLLAGAIIKAGDLVIDGSIRGRLEKLAKAINS